MKKIYMCLLVLVGAMMMSAAEFPVALPNVGDARLRVCAQNTQNYYVVDLSAERPSYGDIAGLENKTARMVRSFLHVDADIYALCELEVKDSVLSYLTLAMNDSVGENLYAYVKDGLDADGTYIKSGFIYRKDKVKPYGSSVAGSNETYYNNTMRIQAFEELATGERFVLSMNHFKAKDNTEDAGEAKRQRNANNLVLKLSQQSQDPDQLVLGDFNCEVNEAPLQYLMTNAGLTEQLLRFDENAYSFLHYGNETLIDHAFANASMAAQITGAGVFHINSPTNWFGEFHYSDHDAVLVGINLYHEQPDCENLDEWQDFCTGLGSFADVRISGNSYWGVSATYGTTINGFNKEGKQENWLISPSYDMSNQRDATITLDHNIYYHNGDDYENYQTLWVSSNYIAGDPNTADWKQLTIPTYAVKSYVKSTSVVPNEYMTENFHYALRYQSTDAQSGNYWEIKSSRLSATCTATALSEVTEQPESAVRKVMVPGYGLLIVVDGVEYDVLGQKIK